MDDDFVGDDTDAASVRDLWLIWTAVLLQRGFFLSSSTTTVKKLHCDWDAISECMHSLRMAGSQTPQQNFLSIRTFIIGNMPGKICFKSVLSNALNQTFGRCMQRGVLFQLQMKRLMCHTNICQPNTSV